jgi:hypothetical protein
LPEQGSEIRGNREISGPHQKGKGARSDEPDEAAASGSSQPSAPSTIAVAHMAARIICEVRSINKLMLGLKIGLISDSDRSPFRTLCRSSKPLANENGKALSGSLVSNFTGRPLAEQGGAARLARTAL